METLLAQTVTDWEMIVCDSFSEDGSWDILQKFKNDPRIQLHQVPREGLYAGWNECLRRAQGQYIYIATSDDTAESRLLEKLLEPLERNQNIDLAFCDYFEIDQHSQRIPDRVTTYQRFLGEWRNIPALRNGKTDFLVHANFGPAWMTMTAVLFRRSLLEKTGMFRTDRGSFADFEWALRSALATDSAYVPGQWASFRVYSAQATPQKPTWRQQRNNWMCVEDVISDPKAEIPAEWKTIENWQEKIVRSVHEQYLDAFELSRWSARQNPLNFIQNAAAAVVNEPALLAKQMARAFAARPEFDLTANMNDLLKTFRASWPPQKVAHW